MYTKAALSVLLWAAAPAAALREPCADLTLSSGLPWTSALYDTCAQVAEKQLCGSSSPSFGMTAAAACCACGGGVLPAAAVENESGSGHSGSDSGSGSGSKHSGSGSGHSGSHSGSGSGSEHSDSHSGSGSEHSGSYSGSGSEHSGSGSGHSGSGSGSGSEHSDSGSGSGHSGSGSAHSGSHSGSGSDHSGSHSGSAHSGSGSGSEHGGSHSGSGSGHSGSYSGSGSEHSGSGHSGSHGGSGSAHSESGSGHSGSAYNSGSGSGGSEHGSHDGSGSGSAHSEHSGSGSSEQSGSGSAHSGSDSRQGGVPSNSSAASPPSAWTFSLYFSDGVYADLTEKTRAAMLAAVQAYTGDAKSVVRFEKGSILVVGSGSGGQVTADGLKAAVKEVATPQVFGASVHASVSSAASSCKAAGPGAAETVEAAQRCAVVQCTAGFVYALVGGVGSCVPDDDDGDDDNAFVYLFASLAGVAAVGTVVVGAVLYRRRSQYVQMPDVKHEGCEFNTEGSTFQDAKQVYVNYV